MPIYDFRCDRCNRDEQRIVKYEDRHSQMCGACDLEMEYKPSFKTGAVIGLPNGYSHVRSQSREKREIGGADTK